MDFIQEYQMGGIEPDQLQDIVCEVCGGDFMNCPHITCPIHGFTSILGEATYVSKHSGEEIIVVGFQCGCKEVV